MLLPKMIWMIYKIQYRAFIHFGRFLHLYVGQKDFHHYQGNILSYIILNSFDSLVLPMVYVHQLLNQNTFVLLKNPGVDQTAMQLFSRCSWPINALTN